MEQAKRIAQYHYNEAGRIERELENLGSEFHENGIVRTVLKIRIQQEIMRGDKAQNGKDQ